MPDLTYVRYRVGISNCIIVDKTFAKRKYAVIHNFHAYFGKNEVFLSVRVLVEISNCIIVKTLLVKKNLQYFIVILYLYLEIDMYFFS